MITTIQRQLRIFSVIWTFARFIYGMWVARFGGIFMQDDEFMEFSIAHRRKYSIEHIWYQENDEQFTVGLSDFLAKEIGEVFRVILPHADDEFDEDDEMFSIWTAAGKHSFRSPFSGTVMEVNGEVEISPDLVNDSPYDLGWLIILKPHHLNDEELLDPDEYLEALEEVD